MSEGPRPRPGGRGPQPDPARRPAPGVADLRGRLQSGFGSPEGVVFAGNGVLYQDTDPAGSGSVWRKTTPSGNTGWVELTGGGGGAFAGCAVHFSTGDYSGNNQKRLFDSDPGDPIDFSNVLPFDAVSYNIGGFTVHNDYDPGGIGYDPGCRITVDADGWYVAGLQGRVFTELTLGNTGLSAGDIDHNRYGFDLTIDSWQYLLIQKDITTTTRYLGPGANDHDVFGEGSDRVYVDLISVPFYMKASDTGVYVEMNGTLGGGNPASPSRVTTDADPFTAGSLPPDQINPTPSNNDMILWIRSAVGG